MFFEVVQHKAAPHCHLKGLPELKFCVILSPLLANGENAPYAQRCLPQTDITAVICLIFTCIIASRRGQLIINYSQLMIHRQIQLFPPS